MDWKDIAEKVIGLGAPILGEALGGPFGAAAGKILADSLGADPTPGSVDVAISKTDPVAAAVAASSARQAEANWLAALAETGKIQVEQIGQTMRAEAQSEDRLQRWWRPLYALELTAFECPGFAVALFHALWAGEPQTVNGFANLSGLIMAYMAARFGVLGVYVSGRSKEKRAIAAGAAAPTVLGQIAKAIVSRRSD
ncbi:MAG TPA: 3TM-type holin [Pseudolabrys sp.]|nr:3TM-type holin [Pseudolabrys sp.]